MDIRKIRKLIELINETGVGEIEVKSGEDSVRINRQPNQQSVQPSTTTAQTQIIASSPTTEKPEKHAPSTPTLEQPNGHQVKSPMVGTVYLAATPGDKPFVDVGQHVNIGDTLCLIEAMKMFNKIEADKAGVVSARLANNGQPVEYEQTLFIIDNDE